MKQIGKRAWPLDWEARSAGGALYTADIVPENALFGAILRSPYPYARVESIDTGAARAMPGVRAIVTNADFRPGARYFHEACFDRPPMADGVVRFVGQEVAAVAADTRIQALAALAAIRVKYIPLPAPMTMDEALAPGAVELHQPGGPPAAAAGGSPPAAAPGGGAPADAGPAPAGPPAAGHGDDDEHHGPAGLPPRPNMRRSMVIELGEFEEGRRSSTVSVSGRYWFGRQNPTCMETQRTVAEWREDGRLHLWTSTAVPRFVMFEVAGIFGMPPPKVVVHEVAVGGSFGGKAAITDHEVIAAMLAREARCPVQLILSRDEEFATTKSRHGFDVEMTLRADDDGRIRTLEAKMRIDNGAYIHSGGSVMAASVGPMVSSYRLQGVAIEGRLIDTAKLPGGAYRGYGGPQTTFALESLMDHLAAKLGRDPIDLRIQNAHRSGDQGLASKLGAVGIVECLEAVRDAVDWDEARAHRQPGRGIGISTAEEVSGVYGPPRSNMCEGEVALSRDGSLEVRFGGSDAGTGQKTILAQIASEELGVLLERIGVLSMDTDRTPHDLGAWSARGTHYTGHATRKVSQEFAERLRLLAHGRLGAGEIRLEDGFARSDDGEVPLGELVDISNDAIDGVLTHKAMFVETSVEKLRPDGTGKFTATHNFGAHAAVVDVDRKTGRIRLLDYVAANDSGTAINPTFLEGQVVGGVVQGIGGALGEELIFEQGKLVNPAFLHYAIPRAADVPTIRVVLAPVPDELGPYGAKAAGEVSILPPGPAIANAVQDAIGVRISSLPITPDKIVNALAEKEGRTRSFGIWRRPDRWWIAVVRWAYPMGLFKLLHDRQLARHDQAEPPAPSISEIGLPTTVDGAIQLLDKDAAPLGGGTDLQLLRHQNIAAPARLVSVSQIEALRELTVSRDGPITIGAGVTLATLADAVRERLPAVAAAIDDIASPQIRNVATVAGNLRQQKRCWFFRNGFNCYKRRGGLAPCYAIQGDHRFYHAAIDGHRCQAVTPSDLATVLVALDAVVTLQGPSGVRTQTLQDLYTGPGEMAGIASDELIVAVTIPATAAARTTAYRKLNLWQGDFAIASAAISVELDKADKVIDARVVLGAVAPVPWRAHATEAALRGKRMSNDLLRRLLDRELNGKAHPLARNVWKLDAAAGLAEHAAEACMSGNCGSGCSSQPLS